MADRRNREMHELTRIFEPRISRMGTDEDGETGLRFASQAGAFESDSLASELADSPVSELLNRPAIGPASVPAAGLSNRVAPKRWKNF